MTSRRLAEVIGANPPVGAAVTVLAPTYNHEEFIERSLRSVLSQQFDGEFFVVAHDDASTDGTAEILRRLVDEFPHRLRAILQSENTMRLGISGARLYMLDIETPYIAFCEGDDLWIDPLKLQKQVDFMNANPWCTLVHSDVEISNEGGSEQYAIELRNYLDRQWSRAQRTRGETLASGNTIMTVSVMLRTSALRREVLHAIHDVEPEDFILFALAAESGDIGFLPEATARYRLHGSNYWSGLTPLQRQSLEIESLWFMAAHLRGDIQLRIRERLLEILFATEGDAALAPVRRVLAELSQAQAHEAALQQRLVAAELVVSRVLSQLRAGEKLTESVVRDLISFDTSAL